MTFEQNKLDYDYNALEPYIDEATMRLHYDKHHATYTKNFNASLEAYPELFEKNAEEIIASINELPEEIRTAVKNHGGGYLNHNFYWEIMMPGKENNLPEGKIAEAINAKWGSFENFKEEFSKAATTQFGSGWAWLVLNNGELEIMKTSNQDSPLTEGKKPLLNIDVWEHAYYLKYQNRRPEHIEAFFNVINWNKVEELYSSN